MTEMPSTSAALARVDRDAQSQLALKKSLDDLDDDDLVAIGRVVEGDSPHRRTGTVAVVAGVIAGVALSPLSLVAAGVVGVAGVVTCVVFSRRHATADVLDLGLSPELAAEVGAAAAVEGNRPSLDKLKVVPHFSMPRHDLLRIGAQVIERLRLRRQERRQERRQVRRQEQR